MKAAKVVDPGAQGSRDQVRFGATVELADEDDARRTLTIVGDDEADASAGRIGWSAPFARALIGREGRRRADRATARRREKLRGLGNPLPGRLNVRRTVRASFSSDASCVRSRCSGVTET